MCYSPAKRSTGLILLAKRSIEKGELQEAERLLQAANRGIDEVVNRPINGKRVGQWYDEALSALVSAKRQLVQR